MEKWRCAFEDWKQGKKYREIAKKYNVSESTVRSWASRKWKKFNYKSIVSQNMNASELLQQNEKVLQQARLLYSSLTDDEKEFLNLNELNEVEEIKLTINLCDIQIARFMQLIKEANEKTNLEIKSISNMKSQNKDGKLISSVTTTNTVNTNDFILRYNSEIEKIKKQKIRCLELLTKLDAKASNKQDSSINIKIGDESF